jgi:exodeoxyribonuclease VII small subunit
MTEPETLSYEESVAEIEEILSAIEGDELPIDALAPKVERAAELLEACKQLLGRTEVRVAQAIDVLRGGPIDEERES